MPHYYCHYAMPARHFRHCHYYLPLLYIITMPLLLCHAFMPLCHFRAIIIIMPAIIIISTLLMPLIIFDAIRLRLLFMPCRHYDIAIISILCHERHDDAITMPPLMPL